MPLRVLQHPYVYDHRLAECSRCELRDRQAKTMCLSARPQTWNGLMVVGEGPGTQEAREKTPFVGPSGRLLNALLSQAELKREETYIANATLCQPPQHQENLDEDFPEAVPACRPRLLEEIAAYEPRVILALGRTALLSLTGQAVAKSKREPYACQTCHGDLTMPWAPCPAPAPGGPTGVCGSPVPLRGSLWEDLACGACGVITPQATLWPAQAKKKMRCPECDGKKTRVRNFELFQTEHKIDAVAGAIFTGVELGLPMVGYVIPSYHPSRILRKAETQVQKAGMGQFLFSPALEHFRKARRLLEHDRTWNFSHREVLPTPEGVAFLRSWIDSRIQFADYFTLDIETDAKDPWAVTDIRCVGLNTVWLTNPNAPDSAPIVVVTTGLDAQHPLVRELARLIEGRATKAAQNGILYDTQVLWRHWGMRPQGFREDSLYAHNAVAPDEKHDLQHIALTYTDSPAWKPPKKSGGQEQWESSAELHLYNARDVYNTGLSLAALRTELVKEDAEWVYRLDVAKAHVARGMDRVGMPVDPEPYTALRSTAEAKAAEVTERLKDLVGRADFNPNAPKQLAEVLFTPGGICSFPVRITTKTGAASTAAEALFPHRGHPFVDTLLEYRKWDRIVGTYLGRIGEDGSLETGIAVDPDWRIRCRWNPIGARTGRWSSSPNLQNWPEELRALIGTAHLPGRILVGADLPNAELRAIAACSGDEAMIEKCITADESRKFDPAYDLHSYVAAIAFPNFLDLPEWIDKVLPDGSTKKVSPRAGLRSAEKAVIFASNYGAGAAKVLETIMTDVRYDGPPLSLAMVERIMQAIFTAFPKVRAYKENTIAEAQSSGYLYDALARRRRCFPLRDVPATEAANYRIQSSIATIIDMVLIELSHMLPQVDPSAFIIAQVHDAIYIECDETKAPQVEQLLAAAMSQEIRFVPGAPWMPFPTIAKSAKKWSDL